eukprot:878275-Amphidinium_carterae.1
MAGGVGADDPGGEKMRAEAFGEDLKAGKVPETYSCNRALVVLQAHDVPPYSDDCHKTIALRQSISRSCETLPVRATA